MLTAQSANPDVALRAIHPLVRAARDDLEERRHRGASVSSRRSDAGVSVCGSLRGTGIWDGTTSPVLANNSHRANRFTQSAADSARSCAIAGRAVPTARAVSLVWGADLAVDGSRDGRTRGFWVSGLYQRLGNIVNFADRVKVLDRFFLDRLLRHSCRRRSVDRLCEAAEACFRFLNSLHKRQQIS